MHWRQPNRRVEDAQLNLIERPQVERDRMGVVFGTGIGGASGAGNASQSAVRERGEFVVTVYDPDDDWQYGGWGDRHSLRLERA